MNFDLVMEIVELALSLARGISYGGQTATQASATIIAIVQKAMIVYEQQTGMPLDPSLIHAETAV